MTQTYTQFELEASMQDRGYARFLSQLEAARDKENQSNTAHGRELIKSNIDDMVKELKEFMASQETVRRKAPASTLLQDYNPEAVVYLALKTIVNSLGHDEAKTTATAINIGRTVSNAATLEDLGEDKENKGLLKHIDVSTRRALGNDIHKAKATEGQLSYFNLESVWTTEEQLKVGVTLVELAKNIGLIQQVLEGKGKTSFHKLVPTEKTMEMIDVLNLCPEFAPVFLPMVKEPQDWDADGNGGYYTLRQPLVKTRFEGHTEALEGADLSEVRKAINVIQQTSWSVHTELLSVAQAAFDDGMDISCFPFNYSDKRAKRTSLRVNTTTVLNLAGEFSAYPSIYFPHNMDWRGRVYPIVDGLSPQGTKLSKALLSFSEGKRINEQSEPFLAIHIANEFGEDKLSLKDRVEWVYNNEERIINAANDPFGSDKDFWVNADNPWGFLRACMEWCDYCADPVDFHSTLPIAFDGSCSGLQHFSAMFSDEVGGKEVNLVSGIDRQDVYAAVMVKTTEAVKASDSPYSALWLASGMLDRQMFKRPTMCYGYGSETAGMTNQIMEEVKDRNDTTFDKVDLMKACSFLAKATFESIEGTVLKAAEAKGWLQGCAKTTEGAIQWTTPDGLPIVQKYLKQKTERFNIKVGEKQLQPKFAVLTPQVDTNKMANAISPNVIHSLDATHIRMVALAASGEQMHSLAMIHDSFGCHAADAPRFFNIIREEFVALYSGDVVEQLNNDLSGGEAELPCVGNLDLNGIIETDYSFI